VGTRVFEILRSVRTIAVLGAHHEPARPAFYVPDYLAQVSYAIYPVNPMLVGRALWGQPVRATLAELDVAIDLVDVFRRSDLVLEHVADILAMEPRPAVVWLQLGVRSDAAAERLEAAGIEVVEDRCTLADHRAMIAAGG
jgi:hypothetical protein